MGDNGNVKKAEHPKPQIELLEDSFQAVEGLAKAKGISFETALQLLTFNELRCMHYHLDAITAFTAPKEDKC